MIKEIVSTNNKMIVQAQKLKQKKYVLERGEFLAESKKVILELLNTNFEPICFFVEEGKDENYLKKYEVYTVSKTIMQKLSSFVTAQDVVGIFKTKNLEPQYLGGKFLILDRIQNPDNMGAIMRTARATGFEQIYLIDCVSEYNSKTIRASMGNQFGLKIYHIKTEQVKTLFKDAQLFCADLKGENVFKIQKFEQNVGIVIGNEGSGISGDLKSLISHTLTIPMLNKVESLNASVSASVLMYDIINKIK
jgi:TrmH family RNA methyltransferase